MAQQALAEEDAAQYDSFVTSVEAKHEAAQARKKAVEDEMWGKEKQKAARVELQIKSAQLKKEQAALEAEMLMQQQADANEESAKRKVDAAQRPSHLPAI